MILKQLNTFQEDLIKLVNDKHYSKYLFVFNLIVLSHFAEHIAQMIQVYLLHWERKQSLGLLGLWQSWLVHSEYLHYAHALFMLIGLYLLGFSVVGKAKVWWQAATALAFYHHIEHFIILSQAISHYNLFNSPTPTSIVQAMGVPRIELHFFYNLMVLVPMLVSLYISKQQLK
jgi:hypothetical protein